MRIHSKYTWLAVAIVAAVVLSFALHLWHRSVDPHQQVHITPSPINKKTSSRDISQAIPEPKSNLLSNRRTVSSESAVTSRLTENSGKQPDPVEAWKALLQDKPDRASIRRFLDSLSIEQLMDLMEYFCETDQFAFVEGMLVPYLSNRWGKDVPFAFLLESATDKERAVLFRTVLTDIICCSRGITTLTDRDVIASHLIPIAVDKTEDKEFRKIVIMKLSSVLQIGVSEPTRYLDTFLGLLQDTTESSRVRGASVTALRRLEDKRAVPILMDKCLDYTDEEDTSFARHAVVALAKYAKKDAIESPADAIGTVIRTTENDRVYGSAVYALSLLDGKDFLRILPDVIDSFQHHPNQAAQDSVESALAKHGKAILEALDHEDRRYILAGVTACTLVPMPEAKERLEGIAQKLPEFESPITQALMKAGVH